MNRRQHLIEKNEVDQIQRIFHKDFSEDDFRSITHEDWVRIARRHVKRVRRLQAGGVLDC